MHAPTPQKKLLYHCHTNMHVKTGEALERALAAVTVHAAPSLSIGVRGIRESKLALCSSNQIVSHSCGICRCELHTMLATPHLEQTKRRTAVAVLLLDRLEQRGIQVHWQASVQSPCLGLWYYCSTSDGKYRMPVNYCYVLAGSHTFPPSIHITLGL